MGKSRNIIRTIKHCDYCGKEFEGTVVQKFCCNQHKILHRNHNLFPEGTDYVECKICSFRGHDLYHHLRKCHKEISQKEYLEKFNLKFDDLASKNKP